MNYLQARSQTVPSTNIPQPLSPYPPASMEAEMGDDDEMIEGESINSLDDSMIVLSLEGTARIHLS